jgi:hypothetical protein
MKQPTEKIGVEMMIEQFEKYKVTNRRAVYTRVPISELSTFRKVMSSFGVYFKMRYRGPRFTVPSAARRYGVSKQTTCLREDATHFSAYTY